MKKVRLQVQLFLEEDESLLKRKAAEALRLPSGSVSDVRIERKSVDARKNNIKFLYTLDVSVPDDAVLPDGVLSAPQPQPLPIRIGSQKLSTPPVVIGAGPCGLFAALMLAEEGYNPIILERGGDVAARKAEVERFFQGGAHQQESNVLFGDGGAGAFSDGKLTARGRDAYGTWVLEALVDHGAPEEILYANKPHLGTDVLTGIIQNLKQRIVSLGAQWHNGTKVTGLKHKDGRLCGVVYEQNAQQHTIDCECAVLAIGHSARDTYEMLKLSGVALAFKPFAVGLRIEHPQQLIDEVQYGSFAGHEKLGAADYQLSAQHNGRGVYTFCNCPGGIVIPSVSEAGYLCVNGMSNSKRDGVNANAAVVVQVTQQDCGDDPLSGIQFQRQFEAKAFSFGKDYRAPVQTLSGFMQKKIMPMGDIKPSYPRGTVCANLWDCLPAFAAQGIAYGIVQFDKKLRGFYHKHAVLTGVEMRSSSPVRILRRDDRQSESVRGLYPAGEGAGYAGGIISAAADGLKSALAIMENYMPTL